MGGGGSVVSAGAAVVADSVGGGGAAVVDVVVTRTVVVVASDVDVVAAATMGAPPDPQAAQTRTAATAATHRARMVPPATPTMVPETLTDRCAGWLDHWRRRRTGSMMAPMFDLDRFLSDCQEARAETEPRRAIRELLARTLERPGDVAAALDPTEAGFSLLHHADDLTVLNVVWAPGMDIYPHDHRMWAAIGIYAGQEDNAFFRRSGLGERTLVESGGKQLFLGDTVVLGDDTIHSVTNPSRGLTGAIHVYGGDFVNQPRSQWGPGPVTERAYDIEDARRQFAQANEAWHATRS